MFVALDHRLSACEILAAVLTQPQKFNWARSIRSFRSICSGVSREG